MFALWKARVRRWNRVAMRKSWKPLVWEAREKRARYSASGTSPEMCLRGTEGDEGFLKGDTIRMGLEDEVGLGVRVGEAQV